MKNELRPRVLDPCCGSRMMWHDKKNPDAVYGDCRIETGTVVDGSHGRENDTRIIRIEPDCVMDFRALPYPDNTFKLVSFDPPHLLKVGQGSWLAKKYGSLPVDWKDYIKAGFDECMRVVDVYGVVIFKWNDDQIKVKEILSVIDFQPLFGHTTGRHGKTHWMTFMKFPNDSGQ